MKKDFWSVQGAINGLITLVKAITGHGARSQKHSENITSAAPVTANYNKRLKMTVNEEGLVAWESLGDTVHWQRKWLSPQELDEAKEKLCTILREDFVMSDRWSYICADHILGVKAMLNAGYSGDYIKKLMIRKNLVQELYDTKVKLRERNKAYARASNTIFELRAKLALGWRQLFNSEIGSTLNRIEKVQQELRDMQNDSGK